MTAAAGAFRWFSDDGRSYDRPDWGGYLYQWDYGRWLYVGHKARRCENCKAIVFVTRAEPCPHCGVQA